MIDLQLLHNFTTFTYSTLSSDPSLRHMLKTTAINMAFDCQFLMRTILALSALHLAHFRHDKKDYYINVGLGHYQVASRLATSRMDQSDRLTREDCEHLHLFAVLTMFFGTPHTAVSSLLGSLLTEYSAWFTKAGPELPDNGRRYRSQLVDYAPKC
jgi:hypothetical protein